MSRGWLGICSSEASGMHQHTVETCTVFQIFVYRGIGAMCTKPKLWRTIQTVMKNKSNSQVPCYMVLWKWALPLADLIYTLVRQQRRDCTAKYTAFKTTPFPLISMRFSTGKRKTVSRTHCKEHSQGRSEYRYRIDLPAVLICPQRHCQEFWAPLKDIPQGSSSTQLLSPHLYQPNGTLQAFVTPLKIGDK